MNTKHPYWPELTDAEGDALSAYFDAICGDCVDGHCHGGDICGCARHSESVWARQFEDEETTAATAVAWLAGKEARYNNDSDEEQR